LPELFANEHRGENGKHAGEIIESDDVVKHIGLARLGSQLSFWKIASLGSTNHSQVFARCQTDDSASNGLPHRRAGNCEAV
jgi:hypothetical protein